MQSSSHHGQQPPPNQQQQRYLPQGYGGGPYPTYSAPAPDYANHGVRPIAPYQPPQVENLQQQQHQRQYAIPADPRHYNHHHQQHPLPPSALPQPDKLRRGATRSHSRTPSSSQEPDDRPYDYDPPNGNGAALSAGTTTTTADGGAGGRHTNGGSGSNKRARVSVGQPVGPPLKRGNACNICRKRKLKCDGQRPACGTCARLKHDCQYGDPAQERIAEKHRKLEERIQSLEAELEAYRAQGSPSTGSQPNTAFPSLNVPHTLPDPTGQDGSLFYNGGGQGSANSQGGSYPQYSTQQLPVESPFIFPDASRPGAPANGTHNGLAPNQAPQDSVAYPLPPLSLPTSAATVYTPVSSAPSNGIGAAHLQSFPFAMNPTPQLSDLVNPSSANGAGAASAVAGDNKAGILSTAASAGQDFADGHPYQQYGQDGTIINAFGTDLPPLQVMLDLAEIYFTTLHQHLPFLHRRRFLYTLHNSASLAAAPSQSLVFSVLAIAAAYHDSTVIRSQGPLWYSKAREKVDLAISANVDPMSGSRVATLTVEMVQALCLLALIEMGQSDHQRAFLSLGQAVRIAAMLGLTRMDEDRVADRTGQMNEKRLRPPALHPLPDDPVLLEECRRTMCAVYVLDRFEAATVGWPAAIAEMDVRVLLPCADSDFENGLCEADGHKNPLWWPVDGAGTDPLRGWEGIRAELEAEGTAPLSAESATSSGKVNGQQHEALPPVSTFGWLCRVVWLGSRVQAETYRASGPPPGGPWNRHVEMDPLTSPEEMVAMDRVIEFIRSKLSDSVTRKAQMGGGIDGSVVMILLILNCLITNLYHLRAASGLLRLPWDPAAPVHALGSSEFAMQRCWQALHSQHEILSRLTQYENAHTSLHQSRANTFTAFVPYVLYTIAFPAKFAIGDWTALVHSRDRSENVPAHLARNDLPSGDDAFPPSYFERRLNIVDVCCDAMDRIGEVWPVGRKFAMMVRGDRMRLAAQTYSRSNSAVQPQHAGPTTSPVRPV